jgi:hypothetical protein
MTTIRPQQVLALALLAAGCIALSKASADPLPGRDVLKFSQQPMNGTAIPTPNGTVEHYWGHDELSTAYGFGVAAPPTIYRGTFMADDFADKFNSPVVHVKWWGSYLNNFINPDSPVNRFLISFESDVPAPAGGFSHPGQPLLNQIVSRGPLAPGSGTFTEKIVPNNPPAGTESLYEYNAELHLDKEFLEKSDTVYWLKIVALVDLPGQPPIDPINPPTFVTRWGWHNRDYTINDPLASTPPAVNPGENLTVIGPQPGGIPVWHFQDDAVTGVVTIDAATPMGQIMPFVTQDGYQPTFYQPGSDGPTVIGSFSKDLAFQLFTTVPEPSALCLGMFALGLGMIARGRSRSH